MNKQEFIDYIKSLTVLELADLVHAVEEEFGVSAAATAVAVTGPQQQQNPLKRRPNLTLSSRASAHRNSTLSRLSAQNSASA